MNSLLQQARLAFYKDLTNQLLVLDRDIPTNADSDSKPSRTISASLAKRVPGVKPGKKLAGQTAGSEFERICEQFLRVAWSTLNHIRPGTWELKRLSTKNQLALSEFDQYAHLADLAAFVSKTPELTTALGNDYSITPDIVLFRQPLPDEEINENADVVEVGVAEKAPLRLVNNERPILHATISCKWTIRSDRAQNARSEALNLIRNRKGNLPHIKIITAEPTPGRIASLALGTGDIDCVYHIALPELRESVAESGYEDSLEILDTMINGRRLRDISDLPFDLAV